jgi:hypothetical protein
VLPFRCLVPGGIDSSHHIITDAKRQHTPAAADAADNVDSTSKICESPENTHQNAQERDEPPSSRKKTDAQAH